MNRKGFSLVEMLTVMSLVLMLATVFWGVAGRATRSIRELSIQNELFEIGEVTESILRRQLNRNVILDSLYLPGGKLIRYEEFQGGEIQVLFFKEKFYNARTDDFVEQYRAFNFKPDTGKLLYQDRISGPTSVVGSIGGYDVATSIQNIQLHCPEKDVIEFVLTLERGGIQSIKKAVIYLKRQ